MQSDLPVTFEMIEQARARMGDGIAKTPLAYGHNLSTLAGAKLFFKLENLQVTGSFKERGALNRLLHLSAEERARGVIAASAGNHAQGVAIHATRLGIRSTIVMPEGTPLMKVARTRRYGADVVLHGATYDDAYARAMELSEENGAVYVHAFDDPLIIAGQGTIGLEILEQNPYLQTLVVPVGGGGLIGGIAAAVKETNPRIRVIGVESEVYASMTAALAAGHPVEMPRRTSIADGIAVRRVGRHTLALAQRYVDDIVTVSEEQIAAAILLLMEEEKVVAEGAAAASLAAVLSGKISGLEGKRTGLVICGGNIDTNLISMIIERGLVGAGRRVKLTVTIPDQPGSLARLTQVLGSSQANILEIHHEREFSPVALGETEVILMLETRGPEHVQHLRARLSDEGYTVR